MAEDNNKIFGFQTDLKNKSSSIQRVENSFNYIKKNNMPFQINSDKLSIIELLAVQNEVAEHLKLLKEQDYVITKKGNYKTIEI